MARKARKLEPNGIYLIHQTASDARNLFENDRDRERFLIILKQTKTRFNFKVFAFCVKNPEDYYLVIGANGSDLSKVMKSINIAYAMYVGSKGKLYKDRYKSVSLDSHMDIMAAVDRFQKEQKSYCAGERFNLFEKDINVLDSYVTYLDELSETPCDKCIKSIDEAEKELMAIAKFSESHLEALLNDKAKRDALILEFRKTSTLSLRELGELFGGLSESTVCKILKEQCR